MFRKKLAAEVDNDFVKRSKFKANFFLDRPGKMSFPHWKSKNRAPLGRNFKALELRFYRFYISRKFS